MILDPEANAERDASITALTGTVPFPGWNLAALRQVLRVDGGQPEDAAILFPGGAAEMVEAFCDLADRRMVEDAAAQDLAALRLTARVRALIALRLARHRPHKEAVRRALALLSLPRHAGLAARITARSVDAIWHAAGDHAADFSWYTKRATLAAVYGATLLYWLRDPGEDDAATLAFLDRRLAGIGHIGRLRRRIGRLTCRIAGRKRETSPAS